MKIVTAENGQKRVKISKSEWENIGKKNGWMRKSQTNPSVQNFNNYIQQQKDLGGGKGVYDAGEMQGYIDNIYQDPNFQELLKKVFSMYPKGSEISVEQKQQIDQMFAQAGFPDYAPVVAKMPDREGEPERWFIDKTASRKVILRFG
jgi:hypothetical protein